MIKKVCVRELLAHRFEIGGVVYKWIHVIYQGETRKLCGEFMALVIFEARVVDRIPCLARVRQRQKYFFVHKGIVIAKDRVQAVVAKNLHLWQRIAQMDELMLG